jgi:DNA polymerase I
LRINEARIGGQRIDGGASLVTKAVLSSWSCQPRKNPTILCLHLETATAPSSLLPELKLISIAGDYGQALLAPQLLIELVPLLENPSCIVIGHNLLVDLEVIRATLGKRLRISNLWDTMLAWEMLNNGLPKKDASLHGMAKSLLRYHLDSSPRYSDWWGEPSEKQLEYSAMASIILQRIYDKQKQLIEKHGLTRVARAEFEAIPSLAEIEYNGIGFNVKKGLKLLNKLNNEKEKVEKELVASAKQKGFADFNPRNPIQAKKMLNKLGYNVENTSAATLEKILMDHSDKDSRFAAMLLKYRELRQKIGFLRSWIDAAKDGRIYPKLEQLGGRSGRITCSRPNIQQVPRESSLKSLFEASPRMSFVEADFSSIEMRLVAVLSGDKVMLDIFKKGLDPHKQTAQAIFGKSEISDEERQVGKTLNYGTIYGGGANMVLSKLPHLTESQARGFLYKFYGTYPGLRSWQLRVSEGAPMSVVNGVEYKISRSALGRIRYVDPSQRNALINTPVQSSGADLQKIALGRLYQKLALPEHNEFKLVNAVHDSILLEVPRKQTTQASKLLQDVMEQAGNEILQKIPCLTDTKAGKDWSFGDGKSGSLFGLFKSKIGSIFR